MKESAQGVDSLKIIEEANETDEDRIRYTKKIKESFRVRDKVDNGADGHFEEWRVQKDWLHQPEVFKQSEKHICPPCHNVKICW